MQARVDLVEEHDPAIAQSAECRADQLEPRPRPCRLIGKVEGHFLTGDAVHQPKAAARRLCPLALFSNSRRVVIDTLGTPIPIGAAVPATWANVLHGVRRSSILMRWTRATCLPAASSVTELPLPACPWRRDGPGVRSR